MFRHIRHHEPRIRNGAPLALPLARPRALWLAQSRALSFAQHLALALALSMAFLPGCTIDKPQAPQFDTEVFLPLGSQVTTGRDLVDDSEYIEGDSTGAEPLRLVVHGELKKVEAGSLLDLDLPATGFSFGLNGVMLNTGEQMQAAIPLRDLSPQFAFLPREVLQYTVPPFTIAPVRVQVSAPPGIEWAHLSEGRCRIVLQNLSPLVLGAENGQGAPLRLRLVDRGTGEAVFDGEFAEAIAPWTTGSTEIPLGDGALSSRLDAELSGGSAGTGGLAVDLQADEMKLDLSVTISDLVADSTRASIPAQYTHYTGTVGLASDAVITEGITRDGSIHLSIENPFPLPAHAQVRFPSLLHADTGVEVDADVEVAAASAGQPGRGEATVDLSGLLVRPEAEGGRQLTYTVYLATPASGGPVGIGTHARAVVTVDRGHLSFDSLRGRMESRRFVIPPTETRVTPPEGIDELSFTGASLQLEVTSAIAFPAVADLVVSGQPEGGGPPVSVPLHFEIPAANGDVPLITRITVDETNSAILDLVSARGRTYQVSGALLVGDGSEGTIRRTDWVWGNFTLSAPLRMRIGRITHRADPTEFTVSRDDQDRLRENVLSASARGTVTNHFPAGLEVRLVFATSKTALALDPAVHPDSVLSLDPVTVAPGVTDPVSGRVIQSRETPLAVSIRPDQVSFFARDRIYAQAHIAVSGEDPERVVELNALDFVEVAAMLEARVRVKP